MCIASTVPPQYDCDMLNDLTKAKLKKQMEKYELEKKQMAGVSDGYLVLVIYHYFQ